MFTIEKKPVANKDIVLREESDDWAVLYDPNTGNAFAVDPVSIFVWKRLDGNHSILDILTELREECKDTPPEADEHVNNFIGNLHEKGLVFFENTGK